MARPNTGEELSKVHAELGELRGRVDVLVTLAEREHAEARENRRLVFDKLDSVEDRVVSVEHKVDPLTAKVDGHADEIGELQVLRKHFGAVIAVAAAAVSLVVGALGWLATQFWDQILGALRRVLG